MYKHYDGFTIDHIPNFCRPKVFFRFSDFLEGKGYIFKFCPYRKLSVERHVVLFFAKFFSVSLSHKKREFLNFFETHLTLPTAFHVDAHFFTYAFVGSVRLLPSCTGNVVNDRGRIFLPASFWRK